MRPQPDRKKIADFCQRWRIAEFDITGALLRDDFSPESNVDVLVTFAPGARWSLWDMARMETELRSISGRRVFLVRKSIDEEAGAWHYEHDGTRTGPVTTKEVIKLIASEKLTGETLVWKQGMPSWTRLGATELSENRGRPPPLPSTAVRNRFIWFLAFAPLLGLLLAAIASEVWSVEIGDLWWITLVLNSVLALADEMMLKRAGYDSSRLGFTWLLVPVYLWKRTNLVRQNKGYFLVWLVLFSLVVFGPAYYELETTRKAEIQRTVRDSVSREAGVECTDLTLVKKSDSEYVGIVEFKDGRKASVTVTIDGEQLIWQLEPFGGR